MDEASRPNLESLMEKRTDDDEMYQARCHALKGMMYQLEDENNLIALKIAETKRRIAQKQASIQQMAEAVAAVERGEWVEEEKPKKGPTADGFFRFAGGRVISLKDAGLLPSSKTKTPAAASSQSREEAAPGAETKAGMPVESTTDREARGGASTEVEGRALDQDVSLGAGPAAHAAETGPDLTERDGLESIEGVRAGELPGVRHGQDGSAKGDLRAGDSGGPIVGEQSRRDEGMEVD